MHAEPTTHPTAGQLAAYGLGKLTETAAVAIARHLQRCDRCRRALENMPADTAAALVRSSGSPAPSPTLAARRGTPAGTLAGLPAELAGHARFRIVRELGRGGMGVVYQAEHRLMERPVAIKVINQSLLANPEALQRFRREVKAAAQLAHPHIVAAYDAEQAGDLHMLVMEYVEGASLAQVLEQKGPLSIPHACHYVHQAALGLQHACDKGMVHRDIKPQNLMLTPRGVVKILDFGLTRLAGEGTRLGGLTQLDTVMGTPEYIAPEQATDARHADIRADIYSLGCTLYCLLAGRVPFQEDTALQTILAHLEQEPPPLRTLRSEVPPALAAVVERMMAKDPAQRYQTPAEVADALLPFTKPGAKAGPAAVPIVSPEVAAPGTGTKWPGDTSRVPVPRKPAATPPPARKTEAVWAEPFDDSEGEIIEPRQPRHHEPDEPAAGGRRWLLLGVAITVVVMALGAALLAIILHSGKTEDGLLVIVVNEPNADVLVDGKTAALTWSNDGKTGEIRVPPGTHQVQIRKDGFTPHEEQVTVPEGGQETIRLRLVAADATLIVLANETGADVYVDGRQVVATWASDGKRAEVRVRPGAHQVEVKKDGCIPHIALVTLDPGGQKTVRAPLPAANAVLVVQVNEPNADVYVDGQKVAVAWANGGRRADIRVKPGTHNVEVRKNGFIPHVEQVTLERGRIETIRAQLVAADGTLIVDVNEPNADVYVDGQRAAVAWGNGGKRAEVRVRPGTHKVEVKKDGFTPYEEEVTLGGGRQETIRARLEKVPAEVKRPAPEEKNQGADPIRDRLDKAKKTYTDKMVKIRQAILADLDKRADRERQAKEPNIKFLDQIKAAREAFLTQGEIPKKAILAGDYRVQMGLALNVVEQAYKSAISDYAKAQKDDLRNRIKQEWEDFRKQQRANPFGGLPAK
jgi:hypothetical protein